MIGYSCKQEGNVKLWRMADSADNGTARLVGKVHGKVKKDKSFVVFWCLSLTYFEPMVEYRQQFKVVSITYGTEGEARTCLALKR